MIWPKRGQIWSRKLKNRGGYDASKLSANVIAVTRDTRDRIWVVYELNQAHGQVRCVQLSEFQRDFTLVLNRWWFDSPPRQERSK